ncbi:hypothetical protein EH222_07595 [candidate division KSB1 bacterium]|nr:MAG: hypothetical protein EH222_07595 [candidate division KSB1 bacterium]
MHRGTRISHQRFGDRHGRAPFDRGQVCHGNLPRWRTENEPALQQADIEKLKIHHLIFAIGVALLCNCSANKIKIVENGASDYRIVKPVNATTAEEKAAAELQRYIAETSGVEIPVVTDDAPVDEFEILIGRNAHLQKGERVKWDELGADGFVIQTSGPTLILAGGAGKGTLYAVYSLLEDHLGCRFYAPDVISLPCHEKIIIDKTNEVQVPCFTWRETLHYLPNVSQDYADWHKLHNRDDARREWGMWVHTFDDLVPAERYYDDHPDYFSEWNGIRMRDGQLCLSNPDVLYLRTEVKYIYILSIHQ